MDRKALILIIMELCFLPCCYNKIYFSLQNILFVVRSGFDEQKTVIQRHFEDWGEFSITDVC